MAKTTNRRQLVKAAIAREATGRVPYYITFCGGWWERLKAEGVTDADSIEDFADNDVQYVSIPWTTLNLRGMGEEWGAATPPKGSPHFVGYGNYDKLEDRIKAVRDQTDRYLLVPLFGTHFEKACVARGGIDSARSRGMENFLSDMACEPAFAKRLLARIIDNNLVMLENVLPIKEIDGVLLGSDWGTQRGMMMSPEMWHDMIAPGEKRQYDLVHEFGKDVWVHSCGMIEPIIPSLIDMGVDVLNPLQPEAMDIGRLKTKYGRRLTFWGGISTQNTLPCGTPDDVRAESRRVRDMMSRDGGYIFAPAQDLQLDVPTENLLALLEVAREGK